MGRRRAILPLAAGSGELMEQGIGIIGAGTIVEHGHLPAYAAQGLNVRAIVDRDRGRAEQVAAARPGLEVVGSVEELLEREDLAVIDIAVDPTSQVELAERALRRGRHVLCQKPLAPTLDEARRLVERCRDCPGRRAVNQQMRWEPIVAEARDRLRAGDLGQPVAAFIDVNLDADFPAGHWLAREPRLMALYGSIHFLDSARYLFGEPSRVTAKLARDPAQQARGETWINAWIEWEGGPMLVIFERYTNWAGDQTATMRVEGSEATVRGRFGIWDRYPAPSPDTVELKRHSEREWWRGPEGRTWLPDAFAGPMLGLLEAIDTGGEPPTGWDDNLRTLALVEALYESSERGISVAVGAEAAVADA